MWVRIGIFLLLAFFGLFFLDWILARQFAQTRFTLLIESAVLIAFGTYIWHNYWGG